MIHPNLVVKNSHSSFDSLFSLPPLHMCSQHNWLCHHKTNNENIFFKNGYCTHHMQKNVCNSFKMWQCDSKHSNTHVMKSLVFFLFFLGLIFCTNVKNKCEKKIFGHFLFWRKKSLDLQKIKKHVFDISLLVFGLVTQFEMFI
jgi:hypothetical protein